MANDYISRQAAIKTAISWYDHCFEAGESVAGLTVGLKNLPAADVRENKHGIWIETDFGCECPFCGNEVCMRDADGEQYKPNFCECCGADMRGEGDV